MKERNIMVFEKIVNGKAVRMEIRGEKGWNATNIVVMEAGGWKLIMTIG